MGAIDCGIGVSIVDALLLITSGGVAATFVLAWVIAKIRGTLVNWMFLIPVLPLIWALLTQNEIVHASWILTGAQFGLDDTGQILMALTAFLWLMATIFGRAYFPHFRQMCKYQFLYLLTMIGNLGLICSLDIASFLMFYTLMSVSAYGLIIHDRKESSLRAGKIYIIMTILGEMLLFVGLAIAVQEAGSTVFTEVRAAMASSGDRGLIALLVLAGFGIKLGIMPLHVWLPLAHPAAPTPASAVLSGAMIKTGLLGIIRVLPLGLIGFETIGATVIIAGLVTAFSGALIGTTQSSPKAVLAYSSSSQMGLVAVGIGAGLVYPDAWPVILPALLFFSVHHGFAKAALFLGLGVMGRTPGVGSSRTLVRAGLAVSALGIAGLPVTSGYVAKNALKSGTALMSSPWHEVLIWLLPLTSITTTLVMARYLYLTWASAKPSDKKGLSAMLVLPWVFLTAGVVAIPLFGTSFGLVDPSWAKLEPSYLWTALWPVGLAGLLLLVVLKYESVRALVGRNAIPAGDLVNLVPYLGKLVSVTETGHTSESTAQQIHIEPSYANMLARRVSRLYAFDSLIPFEARTVGLVCVCSLLLAIALIVT